MDYSRTVVDRYWKELSSLSISPELGSDEYTRWLLHDDSLAFLLRTTLGTMPIYVAAGDFFMYSVLVPEESLVGDYVEDLLQWNFMVSQGWGYGFYYEDGEPRKQICPPLDYTGTQRLNDREPLIFYRCFEGFADGAQVYLELSQTVSHVLGVHWSEIHSAYCKLDRLGDIKSVVDVAVGDQGLLSIADFEELELYLFLTDTAIVRVFDVTRYRGSPWSQENSDESVISIEERNAELHARRVVQGNTQSYLRGFQVIRRASSDETMIRVVRGRGREAKVYVDFIALDWKHEKIGECSCAPEQLGNYFVESDLPFGTSPAFFRPEVVLKYKQDPSKYSVEERTIHCRGTWSLRYDVNEAGQVCVYLKDLSHLPHSEQLYWKSFNERPKAGISKRAYRTDFLGQWYTEYDPLVSLKQRLREFPLADQFGIAQPIWARPDSPSPFSRLAHVLTDSKKEWEDQILELTRIIVDRLSKKNLRKVARALGCDNPSLGSLKLLRVCLVNLRIDSEVIEEVVKPLEDLQQLRSSGIAHFGDSTPDVNLGKHYRDLLTSIDNSMRLLAEFVEQHYFDIPKAGGAKDSSDHQPFPQTGQLATNTNLSLDDLHERVTPSRAIVYCFIVTTIEAQGGHLVQMGSGPNFQGDLVTLCTCKHRMRTYTDLDDWAGKWIAGFTGVHTGKGRNYLVCLTRVSQAFESHQAFWSAKTIPTKAKRAKAAHLSKFGDIYRPRSEGGNPFDPRDYIPPRDDHVHCPNDHWHSDIAYTGCSGRVAALLVGDPEYSLLWDQPMIVHTASLHRGVKKCELGDLLAQLEMGQIL